MPGIPQRVSRLVHTAHFLHQSAVLRGPTISASVAEENKDVASMDRLLRVVRESRIAALCVNNEHVSSLYRREIQPSLPQVSAGQLPRPLVVQPHANSVMPMRTPILWSEALLKQTVLESTPSDSGSTPPPFSDFEDSLTPRNMGDSYSELVLPFGSSSEILEQYTNASGGIRTGKCVFLCLTFHVHD